MVPSCGYLENVYISQFCSNNAVFLKTLGAHHTLGARLKRSSPKYCDTIKHPKNETFWVHDIVTRPDKYHWAATVRNQLETQHCEKIREFSFGPGGVYGV